MTLPLRSAIEADEGRVFVHESGHALMAVLEGIVCHGIYFDKLGGKFCAIAEPPSNPAGYAHNDYLYVAASGAAELILVVIATMKAHSQTTEILPAPVHRLFRHP